MAVMRNARARPRLGPADELPLVSVVMATYNWSSVLAYGIRSVLGQTYPNVELLVMGDGCTDDSEEVVASFGDERVRWHNLPENSGSQSAPNNEGIARAQGEFVAYHGHDDLWLPTHLSLLVDGLRGADADVANTLTALIGPKGSNIRGIAGHGPPHDFAPPSSLIHRREAGVEIGGWKDYRTLYRPPDHDFKARLADSGLRFTVVPALTVFKFASSLRRGSYREKPCHEQAEYFRRMHTERAFVQRELARTMWVNLFRRSHYPEEYLDPPANPPPGWQVSQARKIRGLD